jgi:hypothetical protein
MTDPYSHMTTEQLADRVIDLEAALDRIHRDKAMALLNRLRPDLEALSDHLGSIGMTGLAWSAEHLAHPDVPEMVRTFRDPYVPTTGDTDDEPPF